MPKIIGKSLHEHRQMTRHKLFSALSTLMAERGFDSITLADIAQAADVGRTAVYNHFPDKEALLLGFITHETEQYALTLERALADVDDPVEQLRTYIRQQARLARVHVDVVDRDAVDSRRRDEARVLLDARQVRAHAAVGVEDGAARVASFDLPHDRVDGHVVPVVEHAQCVRGLVPHGGDGRGPVEGCGARAHDVEPGVHEARVVVGRDLQPAVAVRDDEPLAAGDGSGVAQDEVRAFFVHGHRAGAAALDGTAAVTAVRHEPAHALRMLDHWDNVDVHRCRPARRPRPRGRRARGPTRVDGRVDLALTLARHEVTLVEIDPVRDETPAWLDDARILGRGT